MRIICEACNGRGKVQYHRLLTNLSLITFKDEAPLQVVTKERNCEWCEGQGSYSWKWLPNSVIAKTMDSTKVIVASCKLAIEIIRSER